MDIALKRLKSSFSGFQSGRYMVKGQKTGSSWQKKVRCSPIKVFGRGVRDFRVQIRRQWKLFVVRFQGANDVTAAIV